MTRTRSRSTNALQTGKRKRKRRRKRKTGTQQRGRRRKIVFREGREEEEKRTVAKFDENLLPIILKVFRFFVTCNQWIIG